MRTLTPGGRLGRAPAAALVALTLALAAPAGAVDLVETATLEARIAAGELPPVAERAPSVPRVVEVAEPGQHGGDLRTIMGRSKDIRLMVVYGYARLVGYTPELEMLPDILEDVTVEEGRIFTFKLRPGHKWSDGHPFTAEDFRYWWEDMANNEELSPFGAPALLQVAGEFPQVRVVDETTVQYVWSNPNPYFLPLLAGASPFYIYAPSHYLKQFHPAYADAAELKKMVKKSRRRSWASLHNSRDNMYNSDNPALPSLQPWTNTTRPPSQRFTFERNPYFHRVDQNGRQLPYFDRVVMTIADSKLIPAKAGAGDTDLQARSLFMTHYPFLREAEAREDFSTLLWDTAKGSHMALFPNLNHADPAWRKLFRDVRFRRALSLGIDRDAINQVLFFGLAQPSNNTVQEASPLYRDQYRMVWTEFDPDRANELLDEIGLTERSSSGLRLLADGRPLELVIETAGEDTEQIDVLELIHDTWQELGIKVFTRPSQREVFRNRVFAGETMIAIWSGLENGIPTPDTSPDELAPTKQIKLQWPAWGQYIETKGKAGQPADIPEAQHLLRLNDEWSRTATTDERESIWHEMLALYTDQQFSIGVVCCTKQPVVITNGMKNVPQDGIYNWDPGAHFGMYMPDTFWLDASVN